MADKRAVWGDRSPKLFFDNHLITINCIFNLVYKIFYVMAYNISVQKLQFCVAGLNIRVNNIDL